MASKQTKIKLTFPSGFRVMAVWEQKTPIHITLTERHRTTLTQYKYKLKTDTHVVSG